jgi:hypothetical protein
MFINGTNNNQVTGLPSGLEDDSVFWVLSNRANILYAGGFVVGNVGDTKLNGLVLYDLAKGDYAKTQPPPFAGPDSVAIYGLANQPNSANVFVGGRFSTAGSLDCPGMCVWNSQTSQWNRPGTGFGGQVWAMQFSAQEKLVVGGNLTLNDTATAMATFDTKTQAWTAVPGADALPGTVTALSPVDGAISQFWVSGNAPNQLHFLMLYDGKTWRSVGDKLGQGTVIRAVQVLSVNKNSRHGKSDLLAEDQTLLVTGHLNILGLGNASSALFNGTDFTPFILTNNGNKAGSLWQIFSQKPIPYKSKRKSRFPKPFIMSRLKVFNPLTYRNTGGRLAVGFVVLIALAIALALIFILVVIGIFAERIRRKREGYVPAPTNMYDKNSNMERIPPQHLFGNLNTAGRGPGGAPMI